MNGAEYNKIVDLHADGLYRFILKNLKDEDDSQDVVQDAFEKLWVNRDKVEAARGKSYLFTTAYHTMIDRIRKDRRLVALEDVHTEIYGYSDEYTGTKEVLDKALDRLPDTQRSAVLLRDYEGYSYQEIGEITGLNEGQVKVYIHRARQTMRQYIDKLESYCHEDK